MTHRQRLLSALRGDIPDQVPVTWELVGRFAHVLCGRTDWRGQCDAHRAVGSSIFNLQGVGPHLSFEPDPNCESSTRHEQQPDGSTISLTTIRTPRGCLTEKSLSGYLPHDPTVGRTVEFPVKTREDYEAYHEYLRAGLHTPSWDVSASQEARDYVGEDGLVNFWMPDALYALSGARHDAEFIVDLVEEPDLMERLLDTAQERVRLGVRAFNESAADVLVFDICWASTSLLSPSLVRRYVIPRAREVMRMVAPGKMIGFFTSGRIRDVLADLVELEPVFIQHLDVLGDCDLAEVKRSFGERVCLMGNYNPVVLSRGTVQDARAEAQRCLEAAMAGGGYVMTTSDEVPADAKPENMRAVVAHVARHGRYG